MLTKQAKETLIATIGSTALIALVIGLSMGLPRRRAPLTASSAAKGAPYEMMPPCINAGFSWDGIIRAYVEPVVVHSFPDAVGGEPHALATLNTLGIVTYSDQSRTPFLNVRTGQLRTRSEMTENNRVLIEMSDMSFRTIAYCRFFLQALKLHWTRTVNSACYSANNNFAAAMFMSLPPAIGFIFLIERVRYRSIQFITREPARRRITRTQGEMYNAMRRMDTTGARPRPLGLCTQLGIMMERHLNMRVLIPTVCNPPPQDEEFGTFSGGGTSNSGGVSVFSLGQESSAQASADMGVGIESTTTTSGTTSSGGK
jgi:hypothetical protein